MWLQLHQDERRFAVKPILDDDRVILALPSNPGLHDRFDLVIIDIDDVGQHAVHRGPAPIREVARHDCDCEICLVSHQQRSVPVVDEASCRGDIDLAQGVDLGLVLVLASLNELHIDQLYDENSKHQDH